jgi:DNA repair protein RadC
MSRHISPCTSCPKHSRSSQTHHTPHEGQLHLFEHAVTYDIAPSPRLRRLREAIAPYLCLDDLKRLAATGADIHAALRGNEALPDEVQALLALLADLLSPLPTAAIRGPADLVARLLLLMGHLDHEEFVVACLDTLLHVQRIVPLYRGTANCTAMRVGEVFRPAIVLGSASIIVAHNHPGSSTEASPEDIQATMKLREAGQILDIELLDHLIITQGKWASLREQLHW